MTSTLDGRLVHKLTASNSSLPRANGTSISNTTSVLPASTTTGLRYSLTKGKKGMTAAMQKASRSSVALALRRNSSNNSKKDASPDPANENNENMSPVKLTAPSPSRAPSLNVAEMIKIFVLLLEPKSKTFELIQLVYPSATTTIKDILKMIPQHATELTLGSQKYNGLCRPKDEQALSNLSILASACTENAADSASICTGEILVAIPHDYSVQAIQKFSQAILTNRRFTKLLRRNRKHGDRKRERKHKHKHRSRDAVHILERHDEAAEEAAADDDQMMQRAMEKAASAAAQANANIPNSSSSSPRSSSKTNTKALSTPDKSVEENGNSLLGRHLQRNSRSSPTRSSPDSASVDSSLAGASYDSSFASFSWIDGGASIYSTSTGDSLGDSISSWSKSLDASFAQSGRPQHSRHRNVPGLSLGSPNKLPRNQQKSSSSPWIGILAAVGAAYLLCAFLMDPQHLNMTEKTEQARSSPLGLVGLLSVVMVLCVLRKVQFLTNRRQRRLLNKNYIPKPPHQSSCPAVKIYGKVKSLLA